jgi:hypothetical protein
MCVRICAFSPFERSTLSVVLNEHCVVVDPGLDRRYSD